MDTYACFKKKFSFQIRDGKPLFKNNESKKVSKLDKLVWKVVSDNGLKIDNKYYAMGKVFSYDEILTMEDASSCENISYYHNNNKSLILHKNKCYVEIYKHHEKFINVDCIEPTNIEIIISCINVIPIKKYTNVCVIELPSGTHVFYCKDNKVMYDVTGDVDKYLDLYADKPTKTFSINTDKIPPSFTQTVFTKSPERTSKDYVTFHDLIQYHESQIKLHSYIIEDLKKRI